jgi:hypothetical protein
MTRIRVLLYLPSNEPSDWLAVEPIHLDSAAVEWTTLRTLSRSEQRIGVRIRHPTPNMTFVGDSSTSLRSAQPLAT